IKSKSSPTFQGGVAALADGVVARSITQTTNNRSRKKSHLFFYPEIIFYLSQYGFKIFKYHLILKSQNFKTHSFQNSIPSSVVFLCRWIQIYITIQFNDQMF